MSARIALAGSIIAVAVAGLMFVGTAGAQAPAPDVCIQAKVTTTSLMTKLDTAVTLKQRNLPGMEAQLVALQTQVASAVGPAKTTLETQIGVLQGLIKSEKDKVTAVEAELAAAVAAQSAACASAVPTTTSATPTPSGAPVTTPAYPTTTARAPVSTSILVTGAPVVDGDSVFPILAAETGGA